MRFYIIIGIILLTVIFIIFCYFFIGKARPVDKIDFGVTFSKIEAERYDLNWKENYLAILDDLKVKKLRLIAYWQEIESEEGNFSFEDLDWQINEAEKRGGEIILAVGRRLPRWPECHIPEWAKSLSETEQQEKILNIISRVVERYKDRGVIRFWQVENEPFFRFFGDCPKLDKKFLDKELALVRSLDSREIIMTESGEFSTWIGGARRGDILGTTLYRRLWSKYFKFYFNYPIPAIFYPRKTALIKRFFDIEKVIVVELQAESWGPDLNWNISLEEQFKSMNSEEFKKVIDYTKRANFSEAYLWGCEWWYWLKVKHNNDSMWEEVKKLF